MGAAAADREHKEAGQKDAGQKDPAPKADVPQDKDAVVAAMRLGWYVAEVRGRNWSLGQRPAVQPLPEGSQFPLPLLPERTATRARTVAQDILAGLAVTLDVAEQPGVVPEARFAARLSELSDGGRADDAWPELARLLQDWDACIQDRLATRSDRLVDGYLLGRGLAECYWALGPPDSQRSTGGDEPSACAWLFLLGPARRAELTRLLGRLAPYVHDLTPTAIAGSLEAWGCVAADPAWQGQDDAPDRLYEQCQHWYDLLVLDQDATTFVKPYALRRSWRTSLHLLRAFRLEIFVALVAVALVVVPLVLFTPAAHRVVDPLLSTLGVLGVTGALASGVAKGGGQALLRRLRQDAYSDLVAVAVTVVPNYPDHRRRGRPRRPSTEARVIRAVQSRRLTPSTPQPGEPFGGG